jgi:hypothetical protein
MEGKKIANYLNEVGGKDTWYYFDEQSNKVLKLSKDDTGGSLSLEKAFNELKEKTRGMFVTLTLIFEEMVEDKPASNGGDR